MIKLTATVASTAAALLLAGTAFAQATSPTRAEVRQEAREHPPASGLQNATPEKPMAASSMSRAEVRADARKNKPASGSQSDVGTTAKGTQTRAQVRKETAEAVKAGKGPETNAGMAK